MDDRREPMLAPVGSTSAAAFGDPRGGGKIGDGPRRGGADSSPRGTPIASSRTDEGPADQALTCAALEGDEVALGRVLEGHQREAYNLAYRLLGSEADARDAVQEAFLLSVRAIRGDGTPPREPARFRPWLLRVVTNAALRQVRRRPRTPPLSVDAAADTLQNPSEDDPADAAERREVREDVLRALLALPETQRAALLLREHHELSYEEIGEAFSLRRDAVAQLLFRARRGLRAAHEGLADAPRPIGCPRFAPLLSAIVDDATDPGGWRRVTDHLRVCRRCRDELAGLRRAREVAALVPLLAVPAGWDSVATAIRSVPAATRHGDRSSWRDGRAARPGLAVAGAAAIGLAVAVVTWPRDPRDAPPTELGFAAPTKASAVEPAPNQAGCFAQTGFCISNPRFQKYFDRRGQVATHGYPISHSFILDGFEVQIFQRIVLQLRGDRVERLNVLDPDVMPMTRANGSVFPSPDPRLADQAPGIGDPGYERSVVQFVQRLAPNRWNDLPVNFSEAFNASATVTRDTSPDLQTLLNLEIWGLPTSQPAYDPGNPSFVYQRFQRGIMHFRAETAVAEGILVGEYFKVVITGRDLPADLAQDMQGSRFLRQYNASAPVCRRSADRAAEHQHGRRFRGRYGRHRRADRRRATLDRAVALRRPPRSAAFRRTRPATISPL